MAKERGKVNQYLEPCLSIEFKEGVEVEVVIDTGFNGSLCLPRTLMEKLGLEKISESEIFGVGGHTDNLDVALATIMWLGNETRVEVLINDGDDRLLGSELLTEKILTVNYQNKEVGVSD